MYIHRPNFTDLSNPIVNRPITNIIRPGPIQPIQNVNQQELRVERYTMGKPKLKNRNTNPFYKSRLVDRIPSDVRLVGKYDIEMDEDKWKWIISEEDKNRPNRQLMTNIEPQIVSKYLIDLIDLKYFLDNLKHKVIHHHKIPITIKELRAEYYSSPWFQEIYKYLKKGICRHTGNE